MGSNVGKDKVLCSVVTQAVKEVAKIPVWVKLTPATANIVEEAEACFRGGADAISSSNTFPSLPPIDPGHARVRDERRGLRLLRRPRRTGDPSAVDGEDGAADEGVPRQAQFSGIGGIVHLRARAQLLPPRLRNGAGLHGGDARSRHRTERHQGADQRHDRVHGASRGCAIARRLPRPAPRPRSSPHSQIKRPDRSTTAADTKRKWKGTRGRWRRRSCATRTTRRSAGRRRPSRTGHTRSLG